MLKDFSQKIFYQNKRERSMLSCVFLVKIAGEEERSRLANWDVHSVFFAERTSDISIYVACGFYQPQTFDFVIKFFKKVE